MMKKALTFFSFVISLFIFLGFLQPGEVSAALGSCPSGVDWVYPDLTSTGVSNSIHLGIPGSVSNVNKVKFYFGDGQYSSDISGGSSGWFPPGYVTYSTSHTYTYGDFTIVAYLGDSEEYLYECTVPKPVESYIKTENIWFPQVTDNGSGTNNWVAFNANTDLPVNLLNQYGTDNLIGAFQTSSFRATNGRGGNFYGQGQPVDKVVFRVGWSNSQPDKPSEPESALWDLRIADQDICDSNTSFSGQTDTLYVPESIKRPSNLRQRSNYVSFAAWAPDNSYTNCNPDPSITPNLTLRTENYTAIYWRPRIGGEIPPPISVGSWTFISNVIDEDTGNGVAGARLELWASDKWVWPPNGPNAPTVAEATIGPLDWCDSVVSGGDFNEKGYCPLSSSVHHPFFFVKKVTNPPGYASDTAECNCSYTPSRACDLASRYCTVLDTEHIRTYYGNPNAGGTWGGHVFKVDEQPNVPPWWQVRDADVLGDNLTSQVPSGQRFLSDGAGGFPGVAIYSGALNYSSGDISSTDWNANATYVGGTYTYSYFAQFVPDSGVKDLGAGDVNVDASVLTSGSQDANGYFWVRKKSNGNVTIQGNMNLGDNKVILLVDQGDITVNSNVSLNDGTGFFMALSSGDLTYDASVTLAEGVYFVQGDLYTGTSGSGTDNQLVVSGSVIVRGDLYLERDLGTANLTAPAELFQFAPHFFFNILEEFADKKVNWSQVVS